jgi:hypothetical protein
MQKCDIKWVQISFIHPKHLKTLVMKEMENIGNGEDPNSINPYACIRPCAT